MSMIYMNFGEINGYDYYITLSELLLQETILTIKYYRKPLKGFFKSKEMILEKEFKSPANFKELIRMFGLADNNGYAGSELKSFINGEHQKQLVKLRQAIKAMENMEFQWHQKRNLEKMIEEMKED